MRRKVARKTGVTQVRAVSASVNHVFVARRHSLTDTIRAKARIKPSCPDNLLCRNRPAPSSAEFASRAWRATWR